MRSVQLGSLRPGRYRVARRDCVLYSVQIISSGAWGRISIANGAGEAIFEQPSTFTGSFWLAAFAAGGLVVHVSARDLAPNVTINWREGDQQSV